MMIILFYRVTKKVYLGEILKNNEIKNSDSVRKIFFSCIKEKKNLLVKKKNGRRKIF